MSWFKEGKKTSYIRSFCSNVLKCGHIPKHVAFIMDGNRRFARKVNCERSKGHEKGFDKLTEVLEWCFELEIPEVTVYAFSIENFKRSKEEVDGLMELAKQKFDRLFEERMCTSALCKRLRICNVEKAFQIRDMIKKRGVCVQVLGDLTLLPVELQQSIARVVKLSKENSRAKLNVCLAYTSRHEICEAIKSVAAGVENGLLKPSDVSERLIEQCLYTGNSPPPDILIRTSGEVRFSDFLLWQCSYTSLSFLKVLWPEFSVWDFYGSILNFQWNYQAIQDLRNKNEISRQEAELESDIESVIAEIAENHQTPYANGNAHLSHNHYNNAENRSRNPALHRYIAAYRERKERRIANFLAAEEEKKMQYLDHMCPSVA